MGGGRPCGRPIYDLLRSDSPQRSWHPFAVWLSGSFGSRSVIGGFSAEPRWILPARAEGGLVRKGFAASFWSRGHASVEGACCWGPPDETCCLLSYRQSISGGRRVRYPLTTDALTLSHDVRLLLPQKEFSACPHLEEFGDVSACDQYGQERVRQSQRQS